MDEFPGYLLPARQTISAALAPSDWSRGQFLAALVGALGWTAGVEVGVSYGHTFEHLLAHCPGLHLVGVDTWAPNPEAPEPPGWDQAHHVRALTAAQAIAGRFPDRATLVQARSTDALAALLPASLDFVWIDGDHGTDAVLADVAAAMRVLKPDGWLLGHDINWPTVRVAVDQVLPGYLIGPDDVWFRPLHPAPGWWAERFGDGWPIAQQAALELAVAQSRPPARRRRR